MRHCVTTACTLAWLLSATSAAVANPGFSISAWPVCSSASAPANPWAVSFAQAEPRPLLPLRLTHDAAQAPAARRPVAVDYSDGYKLRAKIHKIASIAALPVFGAMYVVGQDLYKHPGESESKKGLHRALAATTGVLFGANTLTGAWNLWEGRKDATHRGRRLAHGILMLAADAGFVATGLLAPGDDEVRTGSGPRSDRRATHRSVALTSMGVATASYLMMLFWGD